MLQIIWIIIIACELVAIFLLWGALHKLDEKRKEIDDYLAQYYKVIEQQIEVIDQQNKEVTRQKEQVAEYLKLCNTYELYLSDIKGNIGIAETELKGVIEQRQTTVELAEKEIELELEKRKGALQIEIEEMKKSSEKPILEKELKDINTQIETARATLLVQQEQAKNAAQEEDFINFHTIGLNGQDLSDIRLIREFSPKLTRQEAFSKLIWTEFYQKPIQALCKMLSAEKNSGIYKITNISNQRLYIGQAVDVAARWKEHCKCGLGIGSTAYMTNKFYKALHQDGIENFVFEILEICESSKLNDREAYWIEFYNATTFGYNTKIGG